MSSLLIIMLLAFVSTLLLTPIVRAIAARKGLVDKPDAERKLHKKGTPLGGGIAVMGGICIALALAIIGPTILSAVGLHDLVPGEAPAADEDELQHTWFLEATLLVPGSVLTSRATGMLLAAVVICIVGLADDRWGLRGRQKLLGQAAAVSVLMMFGLMIHSVRIFHWDIELGLLAVPVTLFWMLGAINAINLIDGADGMATTVGIILSMTVAVMAVMFGNHIEAAIAVALAGALLGFLVFNFPPASIFLGDAGSMLIGLVVGSLAIRSSVKGPTTVAIAASLAVMAVPMFDSSVAILRRWLTGRSIYQTDRGHLHHCLLHTGLSNRRMLLTVAILCAGTAVAALVSVYLRNEWLALGGVAAVLGCLVAAKVFGHAELTLLTNHCLALGGSLVTLKPRDGAAFRQHSVRLQGSRNWHELWETLTDFAVRHDLCKLRLDLNLAWLHEGYHAAWERKKMPNAAEMWMTRLPVIANGRRLGRLEIAGPVTTESVDPLLSLVAELLEQMQPCIERLAAEVPVAVAVAEEELAEAVAVEASAGKS